MSGKHPYLPYEDGLRDAVEAPFASRALGALRRLGAAADRLLAELQAVREAEPDLAAACDRARSELTDLLDDWWHDHLAALEAHLDRVLDDWAAR